MSLEKEIPYILSKFNSLNMDILSIQTLSMATSVSLLIGFDFIIIIIIIIIIIFIIIIIIIV